MQKYRQIINSETNLRSSEKSQVVERTFPVTSIEGVDNFYKLNWNSFNNRRID